MLHLQRLAAGTSTLALLRPFPAIGLSRSSHSVTPSQAQICLRFWKRPAERAMIPQTNLERTGLTGKWNSGDDTVSHRWCRDQFYAFHCPILTSITNLPFPRISSLSWQRVTASTQVVLPRINNQRSTNHVPHLQCDHRCISEEIKLIHMTYRAIVTLSWLSSSLNEALPSGPAIIFPRSPTCCNYT